LIREVSPRLSHRALNQIGRQEIFCDAPNSSPFKALVALEIVARLDRRNLGDGGISSLQQHPGGKKRAGTFNYLRAVPSDSVLKSKLSPGQYRVTRQNGSETAFHNEYWSSDKPGIYVDVITGDPLFSSLDKFDSGTGRPTFTKPISPDSVFEESDNSFGMQRVEIRAKLSNSHLGHLFKDATSPTGERYAVNSAALHFVPTDKMESEGYAQYLSSFEKK
jgi:methionine-R-sulfoxide reductase